MRLNSSAVGSELCCHRFELLVVYLNNIGRILQSTDYDFEVLRS